MKKNIPSTSCMLLTHEYFQGHQCNIPADKLSTLPIQCPKWKKPLLDMITVQTNDARARNIYKSYASFCSEKYRHHMYYPCAIHPFSKLRSCLEKLFIISILVSYTVLAMKFSEKYKKLAFYDYILHVTDVTMLLEIVSNFFTGYVEGYTYQHVVLDPVKISWKYIKTWFIVDLLSALSYAPRLKEITSVSWQIYLAALKILRIPALFRYLNNINDATRGGILFQSFVELLIWLYVYLMWSVFFQFSAEYIAMGSFHPTNPRNCSWITEVRLWDAPLIDRLAYSIYRAVGALRKNSNINFILQGCHLEVFYMMSWIIAKLLLFQCGLKYFAAVYGLESAACKYFKIRRQVKMYMNQRKFPPRIKEKILKFYAIRYQTTFFVEERILPCVSGQLREDIIMHTGRQLVRELAFMKHLPKTLLLQISFQLKLVIFTAGDIIYKINNIGDCMYFIHKGTVAIYSESGKEVCHLEDGDFFGEIALVMRPRFRTTSVVAVSNCELFMLDRDDFNNSIACYPTVYEHIKEVATRRLESTSVLDERHKAQMRNLYDLTNEE